jgi:DNA-binding NarL/FixJ family response regulator
METIKRVIKNELIILEDDYSIRTFSHFIKKRNANSNLTEKELAFLKLCTDGALSYKEIAGKLGLSINTINRYREELFKKLELKSRTALAVYAIQTGLVSI